MKYIIIMLATLILCPLEATARGHNSHKETRMAEDLTAEQREQAQSIIDEAAPQLRELRTQMREKMKELKSFAYSKAEDHDTLPRLGQELQDAREKLRNALQTLDEKLQQEVGVTLRPYMGRSCVNLARRTLQPENDNRDIGTDLERNAAPAFFPAKQDKTVTE